MLELLFLNITDSNFYNRSDYEETATLEMQKSDQPYGVYIAGAKKYSLQFNDSYPLVVNSKTNDKDNKDYTINKHGTLIFSSLETGEIIIKKLIQHNKMPSMQKKSDLIYPKGYIPKTTTSYDTFWSDLPLRQILSIGKWSINLNVGNYISNTYQIAVQSDQRSEENSFFLKKLSREIEDLKNSNHLNFKPSKHSPGVQDEGFQFNCPGAKSVKAGEPLIVYGSFMIKEDNDKQFTFFPVNILITSKENDIPDLVQIFIPTSLLEGKENLKQGYFQFDLMELFYSKDLEKYFIQPEIYISGVYKNYFSQPVQIKIGA